MSFPDEEKVGVKSHTQPSRDNISTIPIKKRRLFFSRSPTPPPETDSSLTVNNDTANSRSCLAPSSEAGNPSSSWIALSGKGLSLEPESKILTRIDVNKSPQDQGIIGHDCNYMEQVENGTKDTFCDETNVSLKGIERPSAPAVHVDFLTAVEDLHAESISKQTSVAENLSGNTELCYKETFRKLHIIEPCSVRQEQLELNDASYRDTEKLDVHNPREKCLEFGPNTVSPHTCVHRSNWDLNMTMDTWDKSSSDSFVKNDECDWSVKPCFGSLLGRMPQLNLMGTGPTSKRPNASQSVAGKHLVRVPFPGLHTSSLSGSTFYGSETEACLDLCLKPSFDPESCASPYNLRNLDSHNEMKILSLSLKPTSSTPELNLLRCEAMKREPHKCIQQLEKKAENSWPETLVLTSAKSELHEIGEASRLIDLGSATSASHTAIKPEPVEERDHPLFLAKEETGASHVSVYDYNLLQSAKIPQEAVGTHIISSNTKSDSFFKDIILQTPREEYPSTVKYEADNMALVKQAIEISRNSKKCHSAISAVASIPHPKMGFVMETLVDQGREILSTKQASNEGSEYTDFFIKCQSQGDQNLMLLSEQVGMDVNFMNESSDKKTVVDSQTSLCGIGTKIGSGVETYLDSDDIILQTPKKYSCTDAYEVDYMGQVKQAAEVFRNNKICNTAISAAASILQPEIGFPMQPSGDHGREFVSIKEASNDGTEHADFVIKCRLEEGQHMKVLSESCEQDDIVVDMLQGSSPMNLNEIDSKTGSVAETYQSCDVLKFDQVNKELFCMEEQGDNERKPGNSHVIDGVMHAVLGNDGVDDDHSFEDGELREIDSLSANGSSHLTVEKEKAEDVFARAPADVPMMMPSAHEFVKYMTKGSPEIYMDHETVGCINDVDPSSTTDMQEVSSVTGDSSGKKPSRTTVKVSRDSLVKDKVFEWKTNFDSNPTVVNIDNKGEENGVMQKAGGSVESSFPLSSEPKGVAFIRSSSGRIINLSSASSRNIEHIHDGPLSSGVGRENTEYKSFKRENCRSGHSRHEIPRESSHRTENEDQRGWACGEYVSGPIRMRIRGGSDLSHSRIRGGPKINQFGERNSDHNYIRDQIHGHGSSNYSRSIRSAEASLDSVTDACVHFGGRISRKATNGLQSRTHMLFRRRSPGAPEQMPVMHHSTSEISPSGCMQRDAPDLVYVPQEKNCRTMPGGISDRTHPHGQFEGSDHIPIHRERLSVSPVHRRGPRQLSPAICSPQSQALSPTHWSPHTTDGFNGQAEMVQYRSGTPIVMHESMRSTHHHFARRRGSGYRAKLLGRMMEAASSREHDFPRSGRYFPRNIQPRQFLGECYGSSFARGQNHELVVDTECASRRRYNEVHESVCYQQRRIAGDDCEDISFHAEGPPRSYRYHADGNQGFNEGGTSREVEGCFKNRLDNTSRRYRHIERQQQHEDGFRHQAEQGWNGSDFLNVGPSKRY